MACVYLHRIATPLGTLVCGCTAEGLCLLQYEDTLSIQSAAGPGLYPPGTTSREAVRPMHGAVHRQLSAYFEGLSTAFTIPLQLWGTAFQQQVWGSLQQIGYGSTQTYKQQAIGMQKLSAIRAIASANAANPIMIIVPCHRVVGSGGKLTGYRGGLARKKALLQLEAMHAEGRETLTMGNQLALF